jgi:hypothetical protein
MVSEYDDIVRKNIKNFFIGRVESDVALSLLSGEELYEMVSEYDDIVFDFQSSKRSIFRNFFIGRLISSAITLMSCILKQICLKIFSRHLWMWKGRQKTTSRLEWIYFCCHCKIIELVYDGSHVTKPKASFALDNNTHLLVY